MCDHIEIIISALAPECINKKLVEHYGGEQYFLGLCVNCDTSLMQEINGYKKTYRIYHGQDVYQMVQNDK